MASWIKMRTNLLDDPRVRFMAKQMKCHPVSAVGMLHTLWSLADEHSTDGKLYAYDPEDINKKVGHAGFTEALLNPFVGWLEVGSGYVQVVRFDEHNGESAKARAQTAKRMERHRGVTQAASLKASPDKNRKDKIRKDKDPKAGGGDEIPESEIPEELRTEKFQAAWADWKKYRVELKHRLTPSSEARQLKVFSTWGEARAIAAIEHTIHMGWQGLQEPDNSKSRHEREDSPEEYARRIISKRELQNAAGK